MRIQVTEADGGAKVWLVPSKVVCWRAHGKGTQVTLDAGVVTVKETPLSFWLRYRAAVRDVFKVSVGAAREAADEAVAGLKVDSV